VRERGRVLALLAATIALVLLVGVRQRDQPSSIDADAPLAAERERQPDPGPAARPRLVRESSAASEDDPSEPLALDHGKHRALRAKLVADPSPHGALVGRVISWSTREGVADAELGFVAADVTHTIATRADGSFRFVAPGPGAWQLATLTADGYLPYAPELGRGSVRFVARAGQRIEHADLFLFPAVDYHGRVVDAQGEPVADAEIELFAADSGERTLVAIEAGFRSDADGKFVFHAPDQAVLEARHPDHPPGRAILDDAAQLSHELTIRLGEGASEPGAPITGRVLDHEGVGLDGVEVRARIVDGAVDGASGLHRTPACVTEADGSFTLAPLDAVDYVIVATVPGHPTVTSDPVPPGAEVELRFTAGVSLTGRLIDQQGAPVVAGSVALLAVDGLRRRPVAALSVFDARGEWRFDDLPEGSYELHAIAQGYARSTPQRLTLSGAEPEHLEITLRDGATLFGRVLDADSNEPLALAHVSVQGIDTVDSVLPGLHSTVTDVDGSFELTGIEPGRVSVNVGAFAHDGKILTGIELAADQRHGPLDVALTPVAVGERPTTEIAGIGVAIAPVDDALVINEVTPDGGAEAAGLVPGDRITAVDGESVLELGFENAIQNIRGQAGTRVELDLIRRDGKPERLEVERRVIRQD